MSLVFVWGRWFAGNSTTPEGIRQPRQHSQRHFHLASFAASTCCDTNVATGRDEQQLAFWRLRDQSPQTSRMRSRARTPSALEILISEPTEMSRLPRSTSPMKLWWRSAFSASFSWVKPARLRCIRIVSPTTRRYSGLAGTTNHEKDKHQIAPPIKLCI